MSACDRETGVVVTEFLSGLEEWRFELLTGQFNMLRDMERRAFVEYPPCKG